MEHSKSQNKIKKRMPVLIGHALGQNMNRTLNPQQRNCAFLATPDGRLIVVAYALKPINTDKCKK